MRDTVAYVKLILWLGGVTIGIFATIADSVPLAILGVIVAMIALEPIS